MAVSKQIVVLVGVLSILAFAGAIAVTVIANDYCAFMTDTPSHCMDLQGIKVCCKCSDLKNTKCISKLAPQQLQGFGVSMIIFFWMMFAAFGATTGILYNKVKRGEDRAQLLE